MKSHSCTFLLSFLLAFVLLPGAEAQQQGESEAPPAGAGSYDSPTSGPLFISGYVVRENGAPPVGALIELDCRSSVTREATVDPNGRFSFRVGEGVRSNQQDQDLNRDVTDPFGRNAGTIPFDVNTISSKSVSRAPRKSTYSITANLTGCTLRAALKGYKSSVIEIGTAPLSTFNNVGTIVLYPAEKVRGVTVSATSMLAPKSAKKALEKAKEALRKNRLTDSEKYLKSAIAAYSKYGEAWFLMGRLHQTQGRINEAREAYTKAIETDSLYVSPYIYLSMISAAEQKWQEASDLTERVLALDPTAIIEVYYVNAVAGFNLKNLVQAEKSALHTELLDATHRFPKLHLMLSSILLGRDDVVGSIEQLRKYLKYGPRGELAISKHVQKPYLGSSWETAGGPLKKEMANGAGPEMRLILAEAFLGAGMTAQAITELGNYMKGGNDLTQIPPQLRDVAARIQYRKTEERVSDGSTKKPPVQREAPIDYLNYSPQNLSDFEPAGDQAQLGSILAAVGKNVSRLFSDLFNISAVENVQLEKFGRQGEAEPARSFDYLYMCLGAIEKQEPLFDEYRSDAKGDQVPQLGLEQGYMLTAGFMSAPIIFHPIHQNGSSFRLLGYQRVAGRNTILVAYAQLPDRSRLKGHFQLGKDVHETLKQGIAWIDSENYQIIRLISDLLQPLPKIGLEKLRTEIDLDKIRFSEGRKEFWLPVQVVVTIDWNGRVLRNTHAYSEFKLFDVQTLQRIEKPKNAPRAVHENEPSVLENQTLPAK